MNKELEKIQKRSTAIMGDYPERKAALVTEMKDAEAELKNAKAEQEAAEDLAAYDEAQEKIKRAELGVKFARNAIKKLDGAPRMDEAEYLKAVNVCKTIMEKAVLEYRQKAAALMDQLRIATDQYMEIAADTNVTLEKLDAAANILQVKYPNSVFAPGVDLWKDYALRYDIDTMQRMATEAPPEERGNLCVSHDSVLAAAWSAMIKRRL